MGLYWLNLFVFSPLELLENGTNHDEVHIPEVPLTPYDDEEDAGIISTSGTGAVVAGNIHER